MPLSRGFRDFVHLLSQLETLFVPLMQLPAAISALLSGGGRCQMGKQPRQRESNHFLSAGFHSAKK